jgi:hypothetical protein
MADERSWRDDERARPREEDRPRRGGSWRGDDYVAPGGREGRDDDGGQGGGAFGGRVGYPDPRVLDRIGYGVGHAHGGGHRGRGPRGYARSAERIREDVSDRLTDDPFLDASDIEVRVSTSEVTLDGTVGSRADKRRAEDCAEQVAGVTHVQNNLRVRQRGRIET